MALTLNFRTNVNNANKSIDCPDMTSYLMTIVMFALYLIIYEICKSNKLLKVLP